VTVMDIGVLTEELQRTGGAVAAISADEDRFRGLFDAFWAWDADSFQRLLREFGISERCELVCEWIRSKDCVLVCLKLCGPPPEGELPDAREFAQVVERITGDEELVERLASAVSERDGEAFRALVSELEIEPFCHLLCHWACTIRGRLISRVVCAPEPVPRIQLVEELTRAGQILGRLAANQEVFSAAEEAATAGDCEALRAAIGQGGVRDHCTVVCEWFCTWRCIRICLLLCRAFPFEPTGQPLSEAFEFSKVTARLASQPEVLARLAAAVDSADANAFETIVSELELERFCIQLCHWVCAVICRRFCFCVCPNPALQPWFTTVGYFDIYSDIDATSGRTNKSLPYPGLSYGGGPDFAFLGCLQLGGFCPTTSPAFPGVAMRYRFLYDDGSGPLPITGSSVCPVEAGTRLVNWPQDVGGIAGVALVPTFQTVTIAGAPQPDPVPPAPGAPWAGPAAHVIVPDALGWITVDPNAIGGGFQTLLGFNTPQVVPGGAPLPGVPAGTAVPGINQRVGTDLSITFEATRVTVSTVDFSNGLAKIHINNWTEVNELWFAEFGTDCCTPIDATLSVQFTVDHEEMDSGAWSLGITGCSPSAPGDITPTASGPGVTLSARGGSGTITEDTSTWSACSYTATLTTRPGLTTGLSDRSPEYNSLTFCICGH
jgi:hypothetical protein